MKNRIFFGGILVLFLIELAGLAWFAVPKADKPQDTVAVNEAVKTVENDWYSLASHVNRTSLAYVVTGLDGAVLYRTEPGLSESITAAISHKDTILDVEVDGSIVGKIIIYNDSAAAFQSENQAAIFAIIAAMFLQGCICAGYFFYRQRRTIQKEKIKQVSKERQPLETRYRAASSQTESGRQARPDSQNQVCQGKHHIQFCGLFSQASVSGFPVPESALDYSEYMLDFCSDRGLFPFTALDLGPGTCGRVFRPGRTAVDFVADLPAALIPQHGLFLAGKKLRRHGNIVDISGSDFQCVYQSGIPVHANMRLIAKVPGVPLLRGMGLRVSFLLPVFGAGGCEDQR